MKYSQKDGGGNKPRKSTARERGQKEKNRRRKQKVEFLKLKRLEIIRKEEEAKEDEPKWEGFEDEEDESSPYERATEQQPQRLLSKQDQNEREKEDGGGLGTDGAVKDSDKKPHTWQRAGEIHLRGKADEIGLLIRLGLPRNIDWRRVEEVELERQAEENKRREEAERLQERRKEYHERRRAALALGYLDIGLGGPGIG